MTFKMKDWLHECLVMSFSFALFDASSTFTQVMNQVLRSFLGKFGMVYFNNILIYRKHESDHLDHLQQVLEVLQIKKLFINLKKCTFMTDNVLSLEFVVGAEGI